MGRAHSDRYPMIDALLSAAAYSHPVRRIEYLETHISWVILTGEFAYKVKKPVDLGFLDFRTLEQRRHFCEEELRLNRCWAPRLYLDVVPIVRCGDGVKVGGEGEPVEFAVRMRQFDQGMRLDHLIEQGRLAPGDMLELAEEVARRHTAAARVDANGNFFATTRRVIEENFEALRGEMPDALLRRLDGWMRRMLRRHEAFIGDRVRSGWIRECHGDLHLANIVRLPEGIRAFDCIEFSRELREIDVVADYAFLTMDLIARGAAGYAYTFVNRYLEKTGDYDGARLLPLYLLYRAMVRAKVAVINREQHEARTDRAVDRHTLRRYCALARALVSDRPPLLVLMTGLSGSGKTWLSTRLVPELRALRLRSDIERKRLFGLEESADSESGVAAGIYSPENSAAIYEYLLSKAEALLHAGINVILDASFLEVSRRSRARTAAAACGVRCVIVQTKAPPEVLVERVQARLANGDASEADVAVLHHQIGNADPLDEAELETAVTVETNSEVDIPAIAARIRALRY